MPSHRHPAPRRVVFAAYPGFVLLDFAGPWEVFHLANGLAGGRPPYRLEAVAAAGGHEVPSHGGVPLVAHKALADCRGPVDTLVVPAAAAFLPGPARPDLVRPFRRLAARARRVAAVCGGAFLLAEAGLLDGRRATTHWRECDRLAREYPAVTVEPDAIFVRDGHVFTSAGVTAGIDLALALVEDDLGRAAALEVARHLVMFVRRPGGQTQFSAALEADRADRESLRELMAWAAAHPGADLSVAALAARAHMSPRNFSRVFRREVGRTPARHVERLRVEAARQRLEDADATLEGVASACGFGSANTMRRSFLRVLRVPPSAYRERFRRPAGPA